MATSTLDLFDNPQKRPRLAEPRRASDVHFACDRCGKLHWRREHQMKAKEGQRFCSRECRYAVSAKVDLTCATCGKAYRKFQSLMARSSTAFCSKRCHADRDLKYVRCSWPGCTEELPCRIVKGAARDGGDQYNIERKKRSSSTKYPFCRHHRSLISEYVGPTSRFSGGRSQMLADPEREYDCRILNSRFTKMILFERAGRRCEACTTGLDWNAPPKTWEMDHRIPIFRGGKTKLSNMQILCFACHKLKSSAEKSEVGKDRWNSERIRGTRWLTHYEKDQIITDLRQQVADLKARLST